MGLFEQIRRATASCWTTVSGRHLRPERSLRLRSSDNYQSYMVRFWRTNATVPWRAAVVDPHHDAIRYFANREALYAFLDAQIDEQSAHAEQL